MTPGECTPAYDTMSDTYQTPSNDTSMIITDQAPTYGTNEGHISKINQSYLEGH